MVKTHMQEKDENQRDLTYYLPHAVPHANYISCELYFI